MKINWDKIFKYYSTASKLEKVKKKFYFLLPIIFILFYGYYILAGKYVNSSDLYLTIFSLTFNVVTLYCAIHFKTTKSAVIISSCNDIFNTSLSIWFTGGPYSIDICWYFTLILGLVVLVETRMGMIVAFMASLNFIAVFYAEKLHLRPFKQDFEAIDLTSRMTTIFFVFVVLILIIFFVTKKDLYQEEFIQEKDQNINTLEYKLLETKLAEAEKLLEAEKKATDSELKALKSQMNPHFIFNALNSIQEQFMYGDKSVANEQMGNFTYLTRQILEISGKKQILLATEIDILTKYLELEQMRFTKNFEYQISCIDPIDEDYHEIPPMLIQPFVENSIKHGLMHKNGLKKIQITFALNPNEDYIICTIEDNGIGRKKSAEIKANSAIKHRSFSTKSIEERLLLLNQNLHLQNLITYEDVLYNQKVLGTKVTINIPLG